MNGGLLKLLIGNRRFRHDVNLRLVAPLLFEVLDVVVHDVFNVLHLFLNLFEVASILFEDGG